MEPNVGNGNSFNNSMDSMMRLNVLMTKSSFDEVKALTKGDAQ